MPLGYILTIIGGNSWWFSKFMSMVSISNIEQVLRHSCTSCNLGCVISTVSPAEHPVLSSGSCSSTLGWESSNLLVVLVGAVNHDILLFGPQGWVWDPREPTNGPFQDLNMLPTWYLFFFSFWKKIHLPHAFIFLQRGCSYLKIILSCFHGAKGHFVPHFQPLWYEWKSTVGGFWKVTAWSKGPHSADKWLLLLLFLFCFELAHEDIF